MTWILLRGLARESRHWGSFTHQLSTATGQAVLTLDLPGNGALRAEASPASVKGLLAALRRQVTESEVALPVNVLAMSLGGMVTAHWAQHHPSEVARMVLINTSMRPFSSFTQRLRPEAWLPLVKLAGQWRKTGQTEQIESVIHHLTCQQTEHVDLDLVQWSHIRRSAPVRASNALRQLWAAGRFTCHSTPPACPVLVLSSQADRLVNPVCSARLASQWQVPHHQHPWAGHDLPHDAPLWVCERVQLWSSRN